MNTSSFTGGPCPQFRTLRRITRAHVGRMLGEASERDPLMLGPDYMQVRTLNGSGGLKRVDQPGRDVACAEWLEVRLAKFDDIVESGNRISQPVQPPRGADAGKQRRLRRHRKKLHNRLPPTGRNSHARVEQRASATDGKLPTHRVEGS